MRHFINNSPFNGEILRKELEAAQDWMDMEDGGLMVVVKPQNGNAYRRIGTCYGLREYIILYTNVTRCVFDVVKTFVHELKHLDDVRNYVRKGKEIPRNREDRCEIWAQDWADEHGLQYLRGGDEKNFPDQ